MSKKRQKKMKKKKTQWGENCLIREVLKPITIKILQHFLNVWSWCHQLIEEKVWSEFHQTIEEKFRNRKAKKKSFETILPSRHLIKRIHAKTVSFVRYSERFLNWTKEEPRNMNDRRKKFIKNLRYRMTDVLKPGKSWKVLLMEYCRTSCNERLIQTSF